ncbi:MAG TPA: 4-alpha-glucanotransferase [Pyrinomonadaceae bacterium]|jgi:4-alpha-glucanotransferase|nr:4-alpha-glucanotransferase [Pyrinomonadaceae bacterium]
MNFKRSSGILLHPTSLPGRYGIGDLGGEAYKFVDWLAAAGQTYWQIMPLGPTGYGDSPYQCFSAFAGNTLLVSPERLAESGLLSHDDLGEAAGLRDDRVEFGRVIDYKRGLLEKAFRNFKSKKDSDHDLRGDYEGFLDFASAWLDDWALFAALKDEHRGESWHTWTPGLARREGAALAGARVSFAERVEAHKFYQYAFFVQWLRLKRYANERGVRVVGDMPIFVAHNSADVWAKPHLFKLNEDGTPAVVAGVPPDAFSETGQLWGNPIYDWDRMRADDFSWWVARVRETLKLVDVVRVDHFRGFAAYWEVPAGHETAEHGRWVPAPGRDIFRRVKEALGGDVPVIAEDLGTITPDVHELRDEFGFPGMRVLQFAFGGDPHDTHLPHEYTHASVVYTGTHDNDTVAGWWQARQPARAGGDEGLARERENCKRYLATGGDEIHWDFIRAAWMSVAVIAVAQLQDVLGLGAEARMNMPASTEGNWAWRYRQGALTDELRDRLRETTLLYGRLP